MRTITMLLAAAAIVGIGLSTVPAEARDWQNSYSSRSSRDTASHHGWQRHTNQHQWQRHHRWYPRHYRYGYHHRSYQRAPGALFGLNFR
jgi:hypothetical protein